MNINAFSRAFACGLQHLKSLFLLLLPVLQESVIVRDPIGPIERIIADAF